MVKGKAPRGKGIDRHLDALLDLADGYQRHLWQARPLGDPEVNRFLEQAAEQIRKDSDILARWFSSGAEAPGTGSHHVVWTVDDDDPELRLRLMLALDAARERKLFRSVVRSLEGSSGKRTSGLTRTLRSILVRSKARQLWLLRRIKGGDKGARRSRRSTTE